MQIELQKPYPKIYQINSPAYASALHVLQHGHQWVAVSKPCVEILILAGEHEKFQVGVKDHFEGYENRALHADFGA